MPKTLACTEFKTKEACTEYKASTEYKARVACIDR